MGGGKLATLRDSALADLLVSGVLQEHSRANSESPCRGEKGHYSAPMQIVLGVSCPHGLNKQNRKKNP